MVRLSEWIASRDRVLVMGVLNLTPDSFYAESRHADPAAALVHARAMAAEGADIIDIGGESSRPGAQPIGAQEEIDRVVPVITALHEESDVLLSVDTTKAAVAAEALRAGASIVNDISALRFDPDMPRTIADRGAFVVLMHMQGTPSTMQNAPQYEDVVGEVSAFLKDRIAGARAAGIAGERILIDPGIGFGKRLEDNLALLRHLRALEDFGAPILVGLSRKSFLGALLDLPAAERLEGTIAANAVAVVNGADILRVHDVKQGVRTARVARALRNNDL
jgi:dihydropteroate synthase